MNFLFYLEVYKTSNFFYYFNQNTIFIKITINAENKKTKNKKIKKNF